MKEQDLATIAINATITNATDVPLIVARKRAHFISRRRGARHASSMTRIDTNAKNNQKRPNRTRTFFHHHLFCRDRKAMDSTTTVTNKPAETKRVASFEEEKHKVRKELITPFYFDEIKDSLCWRKRYMTIAAVSENIGVILGSLCGVLAFVAAYFGGDAMWSLASGIAATIAQLTLKYSTWCLKEVRELEQSANVFLAKLEISTIPLSHVYTENVTES